MAKSNSSSKTVDFSSLCRLSNPKVPTGILPIDTVTNGGVVRGDIVAITAAEGVGKCLTKDNVIYTEYGIRQLADMVEVPALAGEGTSIVAEYHLVVGESTPHCKKLYHRGVSPVQRLTTSRGHTITTTPEHKVKVWVQVSDGTEEAVWKDMSDIEVGDKVVLSEAWQGCRIQKELEYPVMLDINADTRVKMGHNESWVMGYLYSHMAMCAQNFGSGTYAAYVDMMDIDSKEKKEIFCAQLRLFGADVVLRGDSIIKFAYPQKSFLGGLLNKWNKFTCKVPRWMWRNSYSNQLKFVLGYLGKDSLTEVFTEQTEKKAKFYSYDIARFAKNVFQMNRSCYGLYEEGRIWWVTSTDSPSGYDIVAYKEDVGIEEVFDIQDVEDCNCFCADGIIVHNSTTMMQLVKNRINQGQKVAFLDIETSFTDEVLRDSYHVAEYQSSVIGENSLFMVSPTTWAEVDEIMSAILKADYYSDVIIDSISSVISSGLGVRNIEEGATIGEDAKMQGLFLRKYKSLLRTKGVTLWAMNQVRANINNSGFKAFGAPLTKPSGGKALKHMADILLTMTAGEPITQVGIKTIHNDMKEKVVIGNYAWIRAEKNRRAMPKIKVMMPIIFGRGVSNRMSLFDILIRSPYLTLGGGGRYNLTGFDEQKFVGKGAVFKYIGEKYSEMLPWAKSQGLLSLIQEDIAEGDEIEEVSAFGDDEE